MIDVIAPFCFREFTCCCLVCGFTAFVFVIAVSGFFHFRVSLLTGLLVFVVLVLLIMLLFRVCHVYPRVFRCFFNLRYCLLCLSLNNVFIFAFGDVVALEMFCCGVRCV